MSQPEGYQCLADFPALKMSVTIANRLISQYKQALMAFMAFEVRNDNHFQEAFHSAPALFVDDTGGSSSAFTLVFSHDDDERQFLRSETHLNELFVARLTELINNKPDDDEVVVLQVFIGVVLFHEFVHHLIRRFNPKQKNPMKIRRQFKGQRMDAGHSLELKVFDGIVMPAVERDHQIDDYSSTHVHSLCIQNPEGDLYRARVSNLKLYCSEEIDFIEFSEHLPQGFPSNQVLLSRPLSNYDEPVDPEVRYGITLPENQELVMHHPPGSVPCIVLFKDAPH
jgi:hypothetical protein